MENARTTTTPNQDVKRAKKVVSWCNAVSKLKYGFDVSSWYQQEMLVLQTHTQNQWENSHEANNILWCDFTSGFFFFTFFHWINIRNLWIHEHVSKSTHMHTIAPFQCDQTELKPYQGVLRHVENQRHSRSEANVLLIFVWCSCP